MSLETPTVQQSPEPAYEATPANRYSFQELADIYNQTRIDYIVPMPMNAKRMEQYVRSYAISLDASVVAMDNYRELAGIGMLGLRGERAWLTRLGVLPYRRGHHLGQFLTDSLLAQAVEQGAKRAQLEVIQGNKPAHQLFLKLGFQETRELLIIRRPPGKPGMADPAPGAVVTILKPADVPRCLEQRDPGASWIDETPSLLQAGSLKGLQIELPSGATGWLIYQHTAFQMAYFVLHTPGAGRDELARALLYHLHCLHPMQDTKVENLPALDARWPVFQELGYVEAFRRIEMTLEL